MTYELTGFDTAILEVVYREYTTSKKRMWMFENIPTLAYPTGPQVIFSTKRQHSRRRKPAVEIKEVKIYVDGQMLLQTS